MQADLRENRDREQTTLQGLLPWGAVAALAIGLTALGATVGLAFARGEGPRYFFCSYLTSYSYFASISLGALFFVALQHATRAGWSVTVRRLAELMAANTPCLAVLFLPMLLALVVSGGSPYPWTDPAACDGEPLPPAKIAYYLNPLLFTLRAILYFAIWIFLARFFLARSLQQDRSSDPELTRRMERASGPALLLLALTVSFAAIDWLMSLMPQWYSTIFGLYYFSGTTVGSLAAMIVLSMALQTRGRLTTSVTIEHYHDLGKLLLGFVIFWGYIAFSQYLLIWYADLPEETQWYLVRQSGPWRWVSLILLFGHLLIPFFGLLCREAKRRKAILAFWAVWLLVAHWIDLYWLVMPSLGPKGVPPGVIDLGCLVAIGGVWMAGLLWTAGRRSLVPLGDPRLAESLAFENS